MTKNEKTILSAIVHNTDNADYLVYKKELLNLHREGYIKCYLDEQGNVIAISVTAKGESAV